MNWNPAEQPWPGGPHPAAIAAAQARWNALSPEEQQTRTAQIDAERRASSDRRAAAVDATTKTEAEISNLLATLARAGAPGLQERMMVGIVRRRLWRDAERPIVVGKAWPCGSMHWAQAEARSYGRTGTYPGGVTIEGQFVPMSRLLAHETYTPPMGISAVLYSGVRILGPADSSGGYLPPGLQYIPATRSEPQKVLEVLRRVAGAHGLLS